jgi:hypothetical protein
MVISDPELGGDIEIGYSDVVPLTVAELNHIQPGAILQVWYGDGATHNERLVDARENFRNIVAYVETSRLRRVAGLEPREPPSSPGHSLYFVGMENGQPMIADQMGPRHSLLEDWPSYPLWIAAQWFDATGATLQ